MPAVARCRATRASRAARVSGNNRARRHRPTLVLLGRTDIAAREPPHMAGIRSERDLKAALLDEARHTGQPVSAAEIDRMYRALIHRREARANLDAMNSLGARVDYRRVDVCDDQALAGVHRAHQEVLHPARVGLAVEVRLEEAEGLLHQPALSRRHPERAALVDVSAGEVEREDEEPAPVDDHDLAVVAHEVVGGARHGGADLQEALLQLAQGLLAARARVRDQGAHDHPAADGGRDPALRQPPRRTRPAEAAPAADDADHRSTPPCGDRQDQRRRQPNDGLAEVRYREIVEEHHDDPQHENDGERPESDRFQHQALAGIRFYALTIKEIIAC